MYYFPYALKYNNWESFTHYNTIDNVDFSKFSSKEKENIKLWSISRWRGKQGSAAYTASYNYYTKIYTFCGEMYTSYDDVVKEALNIP